MSGRGDDRIEMSCGTYNPGKLSRLKEEFFKGFCEEPEKQNTSGSGVIGGGTPHDPVQHPHHYRRFGMEVIDIIRHVLGPEGFRAYCIGNELKYRLRAGDKGDAAQDIAKAMKYREFREAK